MRKKIIIIAGVVLTVLLYVFFCIKFLSAKDNYSSRISQNITVITSPTPLPSPTPVPTPDPGLAPVTLIIPKLNIEAKIEQVGVNEKNQMDVPKDANDVAWYIGGPRPSELGNAVIAGHYDTPSGRPAIFYNLNKLLPGDKVEIVSLDLKKRIFVVTNKAVIPYENSPRELIFGEANGKNLNLITCAGVWDQVKKSYVDRLVIYTVLESVI